MHKQILCRCIPLIKKTITDSASVTAIANLRTQHLGPEDILVGAQVVFDASLSVEEICLAIQEIENQIKETVPEAHSVFLEPSK